MAVAAANVLATHPSQPDESRNLRHEGLRRQPLMKPLRRPLPNQLFTAIHLLELLVKRMVLTPETVEHEDPGTTASLALPRLLGRSEVCTPPLGSAYCVILSFSGV